MVSQLERALVFLFFWSFLGNLLFTLDTVIHRYVEFTKFTIIRNQIMASWERSSG